MHVTIDNNVRSHAFHWFFSTAQRQIVPPAIDTEAYE